MATTYSPSWTAGSKDHCRFLLGDTGADGVYLLQDEEIASVLGAFPLGKAIIQLATNLCSTWVQRVAEYEQPNVSKLKWRDLYSNWQSLIQRARAGEFDPDTDEDKAMHSVSGGVMVNPDMTGFRDDFL